VVVLDPFQAGVFGAVDDPVVSSNVTTMRSLRHSQMPSWGDCSESAIYGPYMGLPPHCATGMDCEDRDFSLSTDWFPGGDGLGFSGVDVDHCAVPYVGHPMTLSLVNGVAYNGPLPPLVPIQAP
jgi:hypothetical protein